MNDFSNALWEFFHGHKLTIWEGIAFVDMVFGVIMFGFVAYFIADSLWRRYEDWKLWRHWKP